MLSDTDLIRYSRHLFLPEWTEACQLKLSQSHIVVAGCGGLGQVVAAYLAASGVGKIWLFDPDIIELSNLQRQVFFLTEQVGQSKAQVLADHLDGLNPSIEMIPVSMTVENALNQDVFTKNDFLKIDLFLECTDHFASRDKHHQLCQQYQKPWLSASVIQWTGQLCAFDFSLRSTPCYACLFSNMPENDARCIENGVVSPLVGLMGNLQALEALKFLTGMKPLDQHLWQLSAMDFRLQKIAIKHDPDCLSCQKIAKG